VSSIFQREAFLRPGKILLPLFPCPRYDNDRRRYLEREENPRRLPYQLQHGMEIGQKKLVEKAPGGVIMTGKRGPGRTASFRETHNRHESGKKRERLRFYKKNFLFLNCYYRINTWEGTI
jgi:Cdc6-like AAA superfamily ATPase